MTEKNTVGFIDQRKEGVAGRRKTPDSDEHKCAIHDILMAKNEDALEILRNGAKIEKIRLDERFQTFEKRLEGLVSQWAFAIILSIFVSVFGGVFALGVWQLDKIDNKLSKLSDSMVDLNKSLSIVATKQVGVLDELEKLAPEHTELMNHMVGAERERDIKRELKSIYDDRGEGR